jgi:hypothetical protein
MLPQEIAIDQDTTNHRRRSWPANITFIGVGMMIGGGIVIDGPPNTGLLLFGFLVALVGIVGLLTNRA